MAVVSGWLWNGAIWSKVYEKTGRHLRQPMSRSIGTPSEIWLLTLSLRPWMSSWKQPQEERLGSLEGRIVEVVLHRAVPVPVLERVAGVVLRARKRLAREQPLADPMDIEAQTWVRLTRPDAPLLSHVEALTAFGALSTDVARQAMALRAVGNLGLAHGQLIRPSKVIATALSAGFHLVTQRARPRPVGSSEWVTKHSHLSHQSSVRVCYAQPRLPGGERSSGSSRWTSWAGQ